MQFLYFQTIAFDRKDGSVQKGPRHTYVVPPRLPVVGSYRLLALGNQH